MKSFVRIFATIALLSPTFFTTACSTQTVADARLDGVNRRQDRMDARFNARQDRWQERGEREDARARARFESW